MIKELSVKNFKSIKDLKIDCRKINLFIGEPNTGKSNILEVLGTLSWCGYANGSLKEYVRFESTQNLFYDNLTDELVEIAIRDPEIEKTLGISLRIGFQDTRCNFDTNLGGVCDLDYSGEVQNSQEFPVAKLKPIKLYRFKKQDRFPGSNPSFLMPPNGSNMLATVAGNRKPRASMARFFKDFGFELVLRSHENAFEFQKRVEEKDIDSIFMYPYILASDTLQRVIFYTVAVESNENSTLIFEEPESHAFPYYTKYLGEKIAFDERNQYFIATHNPYLLLSILEKAPKDDVNVFVTYFRDYQTKVKCLNDEEISELMDYDPFFNLKSFIEEEEQ